MTKKKIDFLSDSTVVVDWVNARDFGSVKHIDCIYDIREKMTSLGSLSVQHNARSTNSLADYLANYGSKSKGDFLFWLLDLNGCSNLKYIPPNFISSLTRLEELYLGGTSIQLEVQGRSKTCLDELKRLSHLTTLEISILHTNVLSKGLFSKKLERYNITIGRCSWDHRLRLKQHETSRKLELNLGTSCSCFDFEDVPPKTPSVKNILSVLDGQGFPELEQLWVQDGPCLLTVVDCFESESRDPFPSLETLVIHKILSIGREEDTIQLKELRSMTLARLPQLTVFCSASEVIIEEEVDTLTPFFNKKLADESFRNLKSMTVKWCNKIVTVFQSSMLERILRLEFLTVSNCSSVEHIFDLHGADFEEPHLTIVSQLHFLHIENLPKLKYIWNKDPRELFSYQKVKELDVEDCGAEEIVLEEREAIAAARFVFPHMVSFMLKKLPEFRTFYPRLYTSEWPMLKKLTMSGCDKIELFASELFNFQGNNEEGQRDIRVQQPLFMVNKDTFPRLEEIEISDSDNLKIICQEEQLAKDFICNLKSMIVRRCNRLLTIFKFNTLEVFSRLELLFVLDCNSLEEIFDIPEVNFEKSHPAAVIQLRELEMFFLPKLKHIWNKDPKGKLSFQNLERVEVSYCKSLKYLFPSSIARSLPQLEKLDIRNCELEAIVTNENVAEATSRLVFPRVTFLKLEGLHQLTTFCRGVHTSKWPALKALQMSHCDKIDILASELQVNLEKWTHSTVSSQLRELYLKDLPKMRHICNKDPQRKLSFQKLNEVSIEDCWSLENIFPASIARNLSQLEQLNIYRCFSMEKIVAEEEGADLEAVTRFDFPRLTSLKLSGFSQLRYFYPGIHTAEWPALNKLSISDCMELGLLASEENNEEGRFNTLMQQPLFFIEKGCFLKLEELQLTGDSLRLISQTQFSEHLLPKLKLLAVRYGESVFPPDILWRFPNLEKLEFYEGSYEEIFSLEEVEKHAERLAQIKSLKLMEIKKLKRIWKHHSKLDLIIQKLEILHVQGCGLTDLLPPSAFFRNLKILHAWNCHKLTSILTSSTAESLVQLTKMSIVGCDKLTEVVARDEGDVTKYKIIFHRLKTLTLTSLSSLTNFCDEDYTFEFPAFEELEVFDCTKMEIFCPGVLSTPNLNKVCNPYATDWIWEGDLNTTIQEIYRTKKEGDTFASGDYSDDYSSTENEQRNAESPKVDGAGPSTLHLE
ncbi:hypothetical protein Dsin_024204 [Dipteronia sinensis]|uniref:Uncharacterized protein n=1 Tax=Dipteronia sinensis TaxID=43782 RepID=A0AAE0A6B4_9ROSI|nr:hypothetical protein Dsin_024204 [Dipteronia sinensis]